MPLPSFLPLRVYALGMIDRRHHGRQVWFVINSKLEAFYSDQLVHFRFFFVHLKHYNPEHDISYR
jgi:hypothetical protein